MKQNLYNKPKYQPNFTAKSQIKLTKEAQISLASNLGESLSFLGKTLSYVTDILNMQWSFEKEFLLKASENKNLSLENIHYLITNNTIDNWNIPIAKAVLEKTTDKSFEDVNDTLKWYINYYDNKISKRYERMYSEFIDSCSVKFGEKESKSSENILEFMDAIRAYSDCLADNDLLQEMIFEKHCVDFKEIAIDILRHNFLYNKHNSQNFSSKDKDFFINLKKQIEKDELEIPSINIFKFLSNVTAQNHDLAKYLYTENGNKIDFGTIKFLLGVIDKNNYNFAKELCTNSDCKLGQNHLLTVLHANKDLISSDFFQKIDYKKAIETVETLRKNVLSNPDMYVNGEPKYKENTVNTFFNDNYCSLILAGNIFDKKTLDALLRLRFNNARDYLKSLKNLEDKELFKKLINCKTEDGQDLKSLEKIRLIDLINSCDYNYVDFQPIKEMTEKNVINIEKINLNLFRRLLVNYGFPLADTKMIPDEKLKQWDLNYTHLINRTFKDVISAHKNFIIEFKDLLKATINHDFKDYISDKNTYGNTNLNTQKLFSKNNLDYEKWNNPTNDWEMRFQTKDNISLKYEFVKGEIESTLKKILDSPVKKYFTRRFPTSINSDKVVIPKKYSDNVNQTIKYLENIITELKPVWTRAKENLECQNLDISKKAYNTLSILKNLTNLLDNLNEIKNSKPLPKHDLTLKMWERNPQKDLFQGNYSDCCIAIGNDNGVIMPEYLMNTAFNMIEIIDNKTNNVIGNALCYFVKEEYVNNNKNILIIDTIEINKSFTNNDEIKRQIRDSVIKYAYKIYNDISGTSDSNVLLGGKNQNNIPINDCIKIYKNTSFIGEINGNKTYLDAFGGWTSPRFLDGYFTSFYMIP